jgi:GntR family transcriptional regulator
VTDPALPRIRRPGPGRPAYRQIEDALLSMIGDGRLAVGARLPPERELAVRLGVSRMTLRAGLDGLARRGLLVRAGGRGTFVAEPKVDQDLRSLRTFPEELRRQGLTEHTVVVRDQHVPAPARVALALRVSRGTPVRELERVRSTGGVPIVVETAWVSPTITAATHLAGSLWDELGRSGHPVVRAVERLEPVVASESEAAILGVAPGVALMRVERTSYDADDAPVEHAVGLFRGDRTTFLVEVSGAPRHADPAH